MATRKNAGRQIVDTIKKVTTKVGVVQGLHSDSYQPVSTDSLAAASGWYFFKYKATYLPSLSESYNYLVEENLTPQVLPIGDNNKAVLDATVIGEDAGNLLIFMAGVEVPRAIETSITIECENAEIVLYLNNQKIIQADNAIRNRRIFLGDTERNALQVIIRRRKQGGTKLIHFKGFIQLDPTIPVIFTPMVPGEPVWLETGEIIYGSLDTSGTRSGLILSWYDNPFAAGWNIERLSYRGLGPVLSFVSSGTMSSGTFGWQFVVSGTHSPANVAAVWGDTLLGLITGYYPGPTTTTITIDPPNDESVTTAAQKIADGELLYELTDVSIVAKVDRHHIVDLGSTIRYVDTSVIEGMPYSYRLSAQAVFNTAVSGPFNDLRTANAFDSGPPGPIVLWPDVIDAVESAGPLVTVKHIYPSDVDLAGYKVYVMSGGRTKSSYTGGEKPRLLVNLGVGSSLMRLDYVPSGTVAASLPVRYGEFDFFAKEIKSINSEFVVDGYVCTTYDFAGNELSVPSGTNFTVTFLVEPPENFTSFDNLTSPSQGQRRPESIPEHMWSKTLDLKVGQEANVESL